MVFAITLSLLVVVYNNAINRWKPFHGTAYVPINVAFATVVTIVAVTTLELTPAYVGLRSDASGVLLPLTLVGLFALGAGALALSSQGHRIADERVTHRHGRALASYVLVRIPIGTALVEEVIFRGVLFAVWRDAVASDVVAALYASISFGLWHIQPTVIGLRMNDQRASRGKVRGVVLGAIVLTAIAGLGLTWLRVWSGSLLGPVVLHAGLNSMGALAAVVAARRANSQGRAKSVAC